MCVTSDVKRARTRHFRLEGVCCILRGQREMGKTGFRLMMLSSMR